MQASTGTRHDLAGVRGLVLAAAAALLLGGCGYEVEFQGGLFDALGVSAKEDKPKETKVAARPGLVIPPSEDKLPVPGAEPEPPALAEGWPVSPEDNKQRVKAEAEQKQKEYCEVALRNARLRNDPSPVIGPLGNCQPGLLGSLTGMIGGQKSQ